MGWLADRIERQIERDTVAVVRAIRMLRPSQASGWPISRLAHIGVGRTYVVLVRLEDSGRVVSSWADGPPPRRRLYRLVSEVLR